MRDAREPLPPTHLRLIFSFEKFGGDRAGEHSINILFGIAPTVLHRNRERRLPVRERILTAVQTLRLQGRPVLSYLWESLVAHRADLPTPKLVLLG